MLIRYVKENELLETMKLSSICFEYPFVPQGDSEKEHVDTIISNPTNKTQKYWRAHLVACDSNNELMASLIPIPISFQFDGGFYEGNGIGNVCTYPQHRKKGLIRGLFEKMLTDSYNQGQVFSYLYPFSESFYNKFGYQNMQNATCYHLKLTAFSTIKESGTFHLLTEDDTALLDDFRTVYYNFASNYNLMLNRVDYDWTTITDAKASINNNYGFLYKDQLGTPLGYIIFQREGRVLVAKELIFDDLTTLDSIFNFMKSYSTDYDFLRVNAPATIPLDVICKDFYTSGSTKASTKNGMVRVINVEKALLHARYQGSGTCCLKITDNQIEENNKIFDITFKNNACVSISVLEHYATTITLSITMPISIFSAGIVGNYKVGDFTYMNEIEIGAPEQSNSDHAKLLKDLEKVFYYKDGFINNYF